MSRNLVIPHLANVLNATSLVLPFPDVATYQQTQSIESELLEIKVICLNHYNASVLISPNQTSKKKSLPSNFQRPSVISTCARTNLTEDHVSTMIEWTQPQKDVLEEDYTRDIAQIAANKAHIDAAAWLFNFIIEKVTPKDTNAKTSLQNMLSQVTIGHFSTVWYTLFYECYPKIYSVFDVSRAEFHT